MAKECLIEPNSRLIEVGPGNGFLTEYLIARVASIQTIEIQPKMAAQLMWRLKNHSHKLEIIIQDVANYKHQGALADRIICYYSFHEIQRPREAVKNLSNSLKVGGYVCLYEPTLEVSWKKMLEVAELFANQGMMLNMSRNGRFTHFMRLKKLQ